MTQKISEPFAGDVVPVEGTVVNWELGIQVNPDTGESFEFDGSKIFESELGK